MWWQSLLLGCAEPTPAHTGQDTACAGGPAVVTDVDETLTTSDQEWLIQLLDPSHDPAERPEAATLMTALAELGWTVFFVTGRGDDPVLADGRTATEATEDWLVDHGFPYRPGSGRLFLADGFGVTGDPAAVYKTGVLQDLVGQGFAFDHCFGNAEADLEACRAIGLADDRLWLVGALAGAPGANPIPTDEAFAAFNDRFLPTLSPPPSCSSGP